MPRGLGFDYGKWVQNAYFIVPQITFYNFAIYQMRYKNLHFGPILTIIQFESSRLTTIIFNLYLCFFFKIKIKAG